MMETRRPLGGIVSSGLVPGIIEKRLEKRRVFEGNFFLIVPNLPRFLSVSISSKLGFIIICSFFGTCLVTLILFKSVNAKLNVPTYS